ncbi:hypothetical protein AB0395_21665 [Streptosporangium sp. NPDC051023]|uniref:hypothetical protein n=1 Tax=Streptosporangium sp. NPDC051023 TaxID=3155410 RepID=UPI0034504267
MSTPVLIVSVSDVARHLRIGEPWNEDDRWLIQQAIFDAQTDLEAYLGRPITPRLYTQKGLWPISSHPHGYVLAYTPVIAVLSATPETFEGQSTGRYTVTYTAGLDAANAPDLEPMRRLVRAHAMASPVLRDLAQRLGAASARVPQSVAVEGQSVTYADEKNASQAEQGDRAAGSLPTFATCRQWRIAGRRAHQMPSQYSAPWPYDRNTYTGQWEA